MYYLKFRKYSGKRRGQFILEGCSNRKLCFVLLVLEDGGSGFSFFRGKNVTVSHMSLGCS